MNPSRPFILRPVATSLVMLAILIAGVLGYRMLPVASLPEVDFPTIQVTTLYPGAGPQVMLSNVTAPLEDQLGEIAGLEDMKSTSTGGASIVTLRFALDADLGVAEQEVQAAINQAESLLPSDLPMPPSYRKVNPADSPILTLAVTSDSLPLTRLYDLIDTRIAQRLSQVQGVGLVSLEGGNKPAVRVKVDPRKLAAFGLDLESLRQAIDAANVNLAKGSLYGAYRTLSIDANDQLTSAQEYRELILKYANGAAVRLSDVAEVSEGAENAYLSAWANDRQALILNVQRQPGANVIDVVDAINAQLPALREQLPSSVDLEVLSDRTETIRASIHDVQFELMLAISLVVMVTFLFLRNLRATFIPSLSVPLTLLGTFGVMYLAGFSVNNLTLMALTIATGFVIDDAIVVLENIVRHLERGKPPLRAALEGSRQIVFTVISLTISLIAVLIPLLFMEDVVGRLFREFALTLTIAILISAFISLTLTPMLCAKLLSSVPEEQREAFEPGHRPGLFGGLERGYSHALDWVLRHQPLTLAVAIAAFGVTALLYMQISKGLLPRQDTGLLQGITDASQSTSFEAMAARQRMIERIVLADPAVENVTSIIGIDGTNATLNSGRLSITLKPIGSRDSADTVVARLEQKSRSVAGISLYLQPVQELVLEDRVSRQQYQMSLTHPDRAILDREVEALLNRLNEHQAIDVATSDVQNQGSELYLSVDRDTASRLGISMNDIDATLYNAFGQRLISTIFSQSTQYRVVLGLEDRFQDGPQALERLYVSASSGALVPLTSLVDIERRSTALSLSRENQLPSALISFDVAPGYSLSDAFSAIDQASEEAHLDTDTVREYQGAALIYSHSNTSTLWLVLAAVVAAYIVLGVLYESYIHPLTILSTLPSAAIGALLALMVGGLELGMVGIVGVILLIGIVKKNAIMMIDFALDAQRNEGLVPFDAISRAARLRFRPIMMTTFAALLGALPLMFASGYGAELRKPLGFALVGGLALSQLLTLFTIPVIYLYFERLSARWQRFVNRKLPPATEERP
ncbi:multidrug efflux RND transporter permease subunit [Halotalea alkalilenta]|uniref:Multidrug transporter subunit MdtC n=1 Tax=Halotalea alkalilenta TaxID=376489 RepID=A0A172YHZ2_9GAMM|nr:multidrug efflux RND transporter permease subunit [Halotalea alkalilenta]ANF58762.1 multidrug transporter subunit MdtC [Halotalea alkalilenta]